MEAPTPPHDERAERSVLGSMMIDPEAHVAARAIVTAADFYVRVHARLFDILCEVGARGDVDVVTVMEAIERGGLGDEVDAVRLLSLMNCVPSAMHIEAYAKIVAASGTRRRLLGAASEIARLAYDDGLDVETACARGLEAIIGVRATQDLHAVEAETLTKTIFDEVSVWSEDPLQPGETRGMATHLPALDRALGGIESGLYLIAARTGIGKTALLTQIMEGFANDGNGSILFTLEMSAPQIGVRMASCLAQVNLHAIKQGLAHPEEMEKLMGALAMINDWPIVIYDRSILRPPDVLAAVRYQQSRGMKVDAVLVDGLWLMRPTKPHQNRTQTVLAMSREMKQVQRELNVPVIMAHQLNRGIEYSSEKRPVLAHLRDGGEQDADVILMLYRDEAEPNITELWIRKNRWGPTGDCVRFFWKAYSMRYLEAAYRQIPNETSEPAPLPEWYRGS